jgi:solute carrier family 45 protein 1/2/4
MSPPAVDPDPTTQIPWPGARKRSDRDTRTSSPPANPNGHNNSSRRPSEVPRPETNGKRRRLSTLDLFYLSISMAGAQIAWTVELG